MAKETGFKVSSLRERGGRVVEARLSFKPPSMAYPGGELSPKLKAVADAHDKNMQKLANDIATMMFATKDNPPANLKSEWDALREDLSKKLKAERNFDEHGKEKPPYKWPHLENHVFEREGTKYSLSVYPIQGRLIVQMMEENGVRLNQNPA